APRHERLMTTPQLVQARRECDARFERLDVQLHLGNLFARELMDLLLLLLGQFDLDARLRVHRLLFLAEVSPRSAVVSQPQRRCSVTSLYRHSATVARAKTRKKRDEVKISRDWPPGRAKNLVTPSWQVRTWCGPSPVRRRSVSALPS